MCCARSVNFTIDALTWNQGRNDKAFEWHQCFRICKFVNLYAWKGIKLLVCNTSSVFVVLKTNLLSLKLLMKKILQKKKCMSVDFMNKSISILWKIYLKMREFTNSFNFTIREIAVGRWCNDTKSTHECKRTVKNF